MGRQFICVGSGRSGTGWLAAILTKAGIRCGHEAVFSSAVALGERHARWAMPAKEDEPPREYDADASWMAVARLPILGLPAILVLRHPLSVVRSQLELGNFRDDRAGAPWMQVIRRTRPEVFAETTEADRALAHWIAWNLWAALHARVVLRLEDLVHDTKPLAAELVLLGYDVDLENARLKTAPVNGKVALKRVETVAHWGDFRPALADVAQALARHWGYEP
jgi:hypothetical protein